MTWANRRRLQYIAGLFGFFLIILFIFLYPIIFKKPTCTDNKKNGNEIGVDCGGSCIRMCADKTSEPIILWSRAFRITDNSYNLVAFIENQNQNSAIEKISYQFRIYGEDNRLIGTKEGFTYIPPNKQFVVFEPRFDPALAKVKSITFSFNEEFKWVKLEPKLDILPIFVDNIILSDDINSPILKARIKNESIYDIPPFSVSAILYDIENNAINVSKTYKEGVLSGESVPVFFTWPEKFTSIPVIKDVFIELNPFIINF